MTKPQWDSPLEQARAMQDIRERAARLRAAITPGVAREMAELASSDPSLTPDQIASRAIVGLPEPGVFADDIDGVAALHFAYAVHPCDALLAATMRAVV